LIYNDFIKQFEFYEINDLKKKTYNIV